MIRCARDAKAGGWFVQDTEIPGLATEAPTLDALRAKLPGVVQDLMDEADEIEIDLIAVGRPTTTDVREQAGLRKAF